MCTALYVDGCFGRTLDLDRRYHEEVVVMPRNHPLTFSGGVTLLHHHAVMGMATVVNRYPLYYEATNEHGLSVAGLHFPRWAVYHPAKKGVDNVAPFELILWVLAQCETVEDARRLLTNTHLVAHPFSKDYPLTPLHWLIADGTGALTVEPLKSGLRVFHNPVCALTNSPPFGWQMTHWAQFSHLTATATSSGLGDSARGLPGDWSSPSRFVRAAFLTQHAVPCAPDERIAQTFRLMGALAVPRGCVYTAEGQQHATVYISCCDTVHRVYYYTTCRDARTKKVCMDQPDGKDLLRYPVF